MGPRGPLLLLALAVAVEPGSGSGLAGSWRRDDNTFLNWPSLNESWGSPVPNITIGTAITLDRTTRYGSMGNHLARAYRLYFDWLNRERGGVNVSGIRRQVRLRLIDDRSEGSLVTEITNQLVDEGVKHFLAPYGSDLTRNAADVVHERGGVMIAPSASDVSVFAGKPRIFGTNSASEAFLKVAMDELNRLSFGNVAYIAEDLLFTRGVCGELVKLVEDRGGELASYTIDDDADQDQVSRIVRSMINDASPKVVVGCVYRNVCHRIIRALHDQQYNPEAIVFTICVTEPDFMAAMGDLSLQVMGVAPWVPYIDLQSDLTGLSSREFVKMYQSFTGEEVTPYQAASSFCAAAALVWAIEEADSLDPDQVAERLGNMSQSCVFGRVDFNKHGQCENPIKLVQVRRDSPDIPVPVVAPLGVRSIPSVGPEVPKVEWEAAKCLNNNPRDVGSYGMTPEGQCVRCADGEIAPYSNKTMKRVCRKWGCEPGKHAVTFEPTGNLPGSAYCKECAMGFFANTSNLTQCYSCPAGFFQNRTSQTSCKPCRPGTFATNQGATQCMPCPAGQFTNKEHSSRCEPCPKGGLCEPDGNGLFAHYTNADGWFLLENGALVKCKHGGDDATACKAHQRCIEADSGGIAMEGPFCGLCRRGYGRELSDDTCQKCPAFEQVVLASTFMFGTLLLLSILLLWLVLRTDFTRPSSISVIILKQVMNYFVITAAVFSVVTIESPFEGDNHAARVVFELAQIIFVARPPWFATASMECLLFHLDPEVDPYKAVLILTLVWAPMWCVLLTVAFGTIWLFVRAGGTVVLHYLLGWKVTIGPSNPDRKHEVSRQYLPPRRSRLITLYVVSFFFIHPRITTVCLEVFKCHYFDQPRMLLDTRIICNSWEHLPWQLLGSAGFLIYSLGMPLGVLLLLYTYAHNKGLQRKKTLNTLGFLYAGFDSHHYYFEAVFMVRKVLYQLVLALPLYPSDTEESTKAIRCMSMLVLAVVFIRIHLNCEPYDSRSYHTLNRIEEASLQSTLITLVCQACYIVFYGASAFDDEHGDASRVLRQWTNSILLFVIGIVHLRFISLVIYLVIRKTVIQRRWCLFLENGFVTCKKTGLSIHPTKRINDDGRDLLSIMFKELANLLLEVRDGIPYAELPERVLYLFVDAMYHRTRDLFSQGASLDDDDEDITNYLEQSFQRPDYFRKLAEKTSFLQRTRMMAIEQMRMIKKPLEMMGHGGHNRLASPLSLQSQELSTEGLRVERERVLLEFQRLRKFDAETVKLCEKGDFGIEELHMSMVRLSRDIVNEREMSNSMGTGSRSVGTVNSWHLDLGLGPKTPSESEEADEEDDVLRVELEEELMRLQEENKELRKSNEHTERRLRQLHVLKKMVRSLEDRENAFIQLQEDMDNDNFNSGRPSIASLGRRSMYGLQACHKCATTSIPEATFCHLCGVELLKDWEAAMARRRLASVRDANAKHLRLAMDKKERLQEETFKLKMELEAAKALCTQQDEHLEAAEEAVKTLRGELAFLQAMQQMSEDK